MTERRCGLLIVAVALASYGIACGGGYVYDDHHSVADNLALRGLEAPARTRRVERSGTHAGIQLHVAAQVEAIGNVLDVLEDLRLRRVALRPAPLLLQLVAERIRILQALDVAATARVLVPEPGSADPARGFEHAGPKPELAHAVKRVQTAEPGANH